MRPIWYIQTKNNDRDTTANRIIDAITRLGLSVHLGRYIPFDDQCDVSFLPTDAPVIFHGAINCVKSIQSRNIPLRPFAWFDFNRLCCHSYYAHWGQYLAVKRYGLYPLKELTRLSDWLFDVIGHDDQVFIRPDTNDKLFAGEVVAREKLQHFMNWAYTNSEIPTALCVVGTPTTFCAEWRLFVSDRKVIAGSQYKDGRGLCVDPHYPTEAVVFAEEVAAQWSPHPIYCLDVGLTPDGYRVIECGSVNCAGWYAADVDVIVKSMTEIAERDF
jgi:hypothetical protein